MGHSSNSFIIIITVMQMLSRVASDCSVNETLDILRDNPMLQKYRSICDHLRNITFPTLGETLYNKSETICVKEFERHYFNLTDFINISCSCYSMGTTYPIVELSKTSTLSSYTTLPIDETTDETVISTTKSTTIIHSLTTGNESDVSAGTKEFLLSTSKTAFADDRTTVSTTVIGDFTIGNKSDISESTIRPLPSSSPMSTYAYNHTVDSTTDTGDFTTLSVRNVSYGTNESLLIISETKLTDNRTTVSPTVVNNFTTVNESDISDSTKRPLLSTSMSAFAYNSTTVSTTVVNNFTTANGSDISDSTIRPLLRASLPTISDDHIAISTFADEDLTTDKSDESDGTKAPLMHPLTTSQLSTYSNVSVLNSTIIRSEMSTSTVMTTLGKKIETTTAVVKVKVVKSRTRTEEIKTSKKAGISTLYALLLLFTAMTLGIIVIITVLIVYKKFRTGSYNADAGLRDSLELEDSL